MQYYVYALVDPRDNKPFYIGKGKGNRAWWHVAEVKRKGTTGCRVKDNHIKKLLDDGIEPTVKILNENLDEPTAYKIENQLINSIGCIITKSGPLTNVVIDHCIMTNKGRKRSAETCAKISKALKGKALGRTPWNKGKKGIPIHSEEYKERLRQEWSRPFVEQYGAVKSEEIIENRRAQLKGKTYEEIHGDKASELKEQISLSMKGKSLDEIIGKDRAAAGKLHRIENYQLAKHQFRKGGVPWNKGKRKLI